MSTNTVPCTWLAIQEKLGDDEKGSQLDIYMPVSFTRVGKIYIELILMCPQLLSQILQLVNDTFTKYNYIPYLKYKHPLL